MEPSEKPAKKRGGRTPLVKDGTWKYIGCKAPPELHATFIALGGSSWLRAELEKHADLLRNSLRNQTSTGRT